MSNVAGRQTLQRRSLVHLPELRLGIGQIDYASESMEKADRRQWWNTRIIDNRPLYQAINTSHTRGHGDTTEDLRLPANTNCTPKLGDELGLEAVLGVKHLLVLAEGRNAANAVLGGGVCEAVSGVDPESSECVLRSLSRRGGLLQKAPKV